MSSILESINSKKYYSNSQNGHVHSYGDLPYGHCSKITQKYLKSFPFFEKASPLKFHLEKGDVLFIPKKWWHWVFSSCTTRCISISSWFSSDDQYPKFYQGEAKDWEIMEKWTNEYLINLYDGKLSIWTENGKIDSEMTMKEFIECDHNKFLYLISLTDFDGSKSGLKLMDLLNNDIGKFSIYPDKKFNFNFWMNFGNIDSGLHYDDQDGLLVVVDGYKDVILYSPNDSKYLYPYPLELKPFEKYYKSMYYNLYKLLGKEIPKDSTVISDLLNLEKVPSIYEIFKEFVKEFGVGNIIWGLKNNKEEIQYEIYVYFLNKDPKIIDENISPDLDKYIKFHKRVFHNDNYDFSRIKEDNLIVLSIDLIEDNALLRKTNKINLYYTNKVKVEIPLIIEERTFTNEIEIHRARLFTVENVNSNEILFDIFKNTGIIPQITISLVNYIKKREWKYHYLTFTNKTTEVGIYAFGLTQENFINFLEENFYSKKLINFCKKSDLSHIQLEVGLHFYILANFTKPSRTAFYGVI